MVVSEIHRADDVGARETRQELKIALETLDQDCDCRAVVLASQGKAFCAGANFGDGSTLDRAGQRSGEAS